MKDVEDLEIQDYAKAILASNQLPNLRKALTKYAEKEAPELTHNEEIQSTIQRSKKHGFKA